MQVVESTPESILEKQRWAQTCHGVCESPWRNPNLRGFRTSRGVWHTSKSGIPPGQPGLCRTASRRIGAFLRILRPMIKEGRLGSQFFGEPQWWSLTPPTQMSVSTKTQRLHVRRSPCQRLAQVHSPFQPHTSQVQSVAWGLLTLVRLPSEGSLLRALDTNIGTCSFSATLWTPVGMDGTLQTGTSRCDMHFVNPQYLKALEYL